MLVVLLLCALLPLSLIFILSEFAPLKSKNAKNLPPSPPKLPIIGNLHQLKSRTERSLYTLSRKHGPLMFLKLGSAPTVVVSSAEMAEEVMKVQDHIFCSRPLTDFGQRLLYGSTDIGFCPYGDYWRRIRKITVLHLLSNKKVKSFQYIREEEVVLSIQKVKHELHEGLVNLSKILSSLSNDVICRAALGKKYYDIFYELIHEQSLIAGAVNARDVFPQLGWVSKLTGLDARGDMQFKRWEEFFEQVFTDHLKTTSRSACSRDDDGDDKKGDLVDILLSRQEEFGLTKDNIKAIILDMFVAGTDTSYMTMEWAMAELLRNPTLLQKAQEEIRNIAHGKPMVQEEEISKMPFLQAVIKETLRLHPPAPLAIPRESMEATEIKGYFIPAKSRVIVNVFAIGRDPSYWSSPEEFQPKRFLDNDVDFRGQHFHFLPFGAGRRICVGMQFAAATMELALANLLYRFDWKMPNNEDPQCMDMTEAVGFFPAKKIPLILSASPAIF